MATKSRETVSALSFASLEHSAIVFLLLRASAFSPVEWGEEVNEIFMCAVLGPVLANCSHYYEQGQQYQKNVE